MTKPVDEKESATAAGRRLDRGDRTVRGVVSSPDSASVGELQLRLVGKHVGGETALSDGSTDSRGDYVITYRIKDGAGEPDLQVQVLHGDEVVAASEIRYDAGPDETINVILPAGSPALASEYETLVRDIAAVYSGPLSELREDGERSDVTYLAHKTGWDARAIAMASLAHTAANAAGTSDGPAPRRGAKTRLKAEPATRKRATVKADDKGEREGLPPAFHYALLRAGASDGALAEAHLLRPTDLRSVWTDAIKKGIIPAELEPDIDSAIEHVQVTAAAHVLDADPKAGGSTLRDLLQGSLGDDQERHQSFAQLYIEHREDPEQFWRAAGEKFGSATADRLALDGKLAYLTVNNAPLIEALHQAQERPLSTAADLAERGYHNADTWARILDGTEPPPQVAGATDDERRANYAELLAAHVRLSFPTATLASQLHSGEISLPDADRVQGEVVAFLTEHHDDFDIGAEPVQAYLKRVGAEAPKDLVVQVSRLQRVYQIAPTAVAMNALLSNRLDSAYQITQYGRDTFTSAFSEALGGPAVAGIVYDRAHMVYASVLQIALGYLGARLAPPLGSAEVGGRLIDILGGLAGSDGPQPFAQATLEELFGQLDYCSCDDCRSILSPAAYLVDLLDYIDNPSPTAPASNPLQVLLARRPDIGALPLTCENTNTALPYIDLVNETLEYYVAHNLTLAGYAGHNTDGTVTSSELDAAPQFDDDDVARQAYTALRSTWGPAPLPFHRDLELLRQHFIQIGSTLPDAMAALRAGEHPGPVPGTPGDYGWIQTFVERAGFSPPEYRLLTDSTIPLADAYSVAAAGATVADLTNVQQYSRITGISYDELVALLETRFVNPAADLIPRLTALNVTAETLHELHAGALTAQQFAALLPAGLDPTAYGVADPDHVADWVEANYDRIASLIVIRADAANPCDASAMTLTRLDAAESASAVSDADFLRMLRFLRVWRTLGLDMPQTDRLLTALATPSGASTELLQLDEVFKSLLPRIGYVLSVAAALDIDPSDQLDELLTCWSDIADTSRGSLYAAMFLNPAVRGTDPVFSPDLTGVVFGGAPAPTLLAHKPALLAAMNLTSAEFDVVAGASPGLGFDASTPLTLSAITAIYRRAWLARTLGISIVELLHLIDATTLNPFVLPDFTADPVQLQTSDLVKLVHRLNDLGLAPVQALYLLWNVDINGVSAPPESVIGALITALRAAYAAVDAQYLVTGTLTTDRVKSLVSVVIGAAAADQFFSIVNGTLQTSVPLAYLEPTLPPAIVTAGHGQLRYDDLAKTLTSTGVLDVATAAALTTAAAGDPVLAPAVAALVAAGDAAIDEFFTANDDPELGLRTLYDAYAASTSDDRMSALLQGLVPAFAARRKREQAIATAASATGLDPSFATALLTDVAAIPAADDLALPGVADLTAVGAGGLTAAYFLGNDPTAAPDQTLDADPVNHDAANPLPAATAAGGGIAARWSGFLSAPQSGNYNVAVLSPTATSVTLSLDGAAVPLADAGGGRWTNQAAVTLTAGKLTPIEITAAGLGAGVEVSWATLGTSWQPIPAAALCPAIPAGRARRTYLRFLKAGALAGALSLTAKDAGYLASAPALRVGTEGWLQRLCVDGTAPAAARPDLTGVLQRILGYAAIANSAGSGSGKLADALAAASTTTDALLSLTGWEQASVDTLLNRFYASDFAGLPDRVGMLSRLSEAFAVLTGMQLSADSVVAALATDPPADTVAEFQAIVRSRYAASDWLQVVKPINDAIRERQRDALVAYVLLRSGAQILQTLGIAQTSHRVATADDLFNYFLMDVEMQPCMETSRIRHALSSIQLFVERSLRNLEPTVSPKDIASAEWVWRKRYRVWQANREVFLWPENWLDPSFRDDQSPFFKDTMAALLQSDITDDSAAGAYLDYLTNLEQVAKLEPCGLHFQSGNDGAADDVAHVVARTAGAHRKHYYRRFSGGSWTPWQEIKLAIEGQPVVPYVWKGRLMLFWLQIHHRPNIDTSSPGAGLPSGPSGHIADASFQSITHSVGEGAKTQTSEQISAVLCFSEYYNGKWQPMKTSDPERPVPLTTVPAGTFDRSAYVIRPWTAQDGSDESLYLEISPKDSAPSVAVSASLMGEFAWMMTPGFVLHNTHSAPLAWSDVAPVLQANPSKRRSLPPASSSDTKKLTADYATPKGLDWLGFTTWDDSTTDIVTGSLPIRLTDAQSDVSDQWDLPFFAEDARNVFYVTTREFSWFFKDFPWFGHGIVEYGSKPNSKLLIPPLLLQRQPVVPIDPYERVKDRVDPVEVQNALGDSRLFRTALQTSETVPFGDTAIGATGAIQPAMSARVAQEEK